MNKLLRASLLVAGLVLVGFSSIFPSSALAKDDPPKNAVIVAADQFNTYIEACKSGRGPADARYVPTTNIDWCNATYGDIKVSCRTEAINRAPEDICTIRSESDGSKVVLDPNNFSRGGTVTNYDSNGDVVGTVEVDKDGDVQAGGSLSQSADLAGQLGSDGCGLNPLCAVKKLPGILFAGLAYLLLTLSGLILGLAGVVFNWVVIRTVFQFGLYFGTSPGMLVAWGVLRDVANIGLLFGFVFIGIATILNTQSTEGFTAKKALPRLIIFAVLLNFSLFATQAIVDVANGFSSIFATYAGEQCSTDTSSVGSTSGETNEKCADKGISGKILQAAGISKVFPSGFSQAFEAPYTYTVMLIMLSIFVTVTAMVLFAASIMLIIRVVVLSILMVTSPIGFAGMVIPGLHKIATDWWHKLINQAFFAPIYLLMVFVSLKLVDGLQEGQAGLADALLGNTASSGAALGAATVAGNMQVVVIFMIVIGFMIASLIVAQKMGATGASFATKSAGALTFGVQGFVGRRTLGRVSGKLAQKVRNSSFGETNLGRLTATTFDKGAAASFSSRNLMGKALGASGAGIDIGKANKTAEHGYHGIEKKAEEARMDYAKSLKGNRDESAREARERLGRERTGASAAAADSVRAEADAMNVVVDAQTAESAATAARNLQQVHRDNAATTLANQRALVAANPADAAAQMALSQMEDQLARETRELAQADEALAQASRNLTTARTAETTATNTRTAAEAAEAAAIAATPTRRRVAPDGTGGVDNRTRQLNYAHDIQHQGNLGIRNEGLGRYAQFITADAHANHAAARAIVQNAGRDEFTRAADLMREGAARAAAATAASAAAPAAPAGGGPAAPAAGGGGHHP